MKKSLLSLLILGSTNINAEVVNSFNGELNANFLYYPHETNENVGHKHMLTLRNNIYINESLNIINELRTLYFSFYDNEKHPQNLNNDNLELYLGENYLKLDYDPTLIQIGYQEVTWGEAFGMHYADIITPSDQRFTNFYDYSSSKIPSFLINAKFLYGSGSVQLIYSPEIKYSKSLPVDKFLSREIGSANVRISKEDDEAFFKRNNAGLKLSHSFSSMDTSYSYYNYVDHNPYYALKGINQNFDILLEEKHQRTQTHSISLARTINDKFVIRADLVYNINKIFNTYENFNLGSYESDSFEMIFSLDLPEINNISTTLIFAQSSILDIEKDTLRDEHERYAIIKLSRDFGDSRVFDIAYTKELSKNSNYLTTGFTYGYSNDIDLKATYQSFWGNEGKLSLLKKTSALELGVKYYF